MNYISNLINLQSKNDRSDLFYPASESIIEDYFNDQKFNPHQINPEKIKYQSNLLFEDLLEICETFSYIGKSGLNFLENLENNIDLNKPIITGYSSSNFDASTAQFEFLKRIFPVIEAKSNPGFSTYLNLENRKFYGFYIYDNKLSLTKFNDNGFISAKDYHDKRNAIVDKNSLKLFFYELSYKSKNPGTDYIDHITEKKKDDPYYDVVDMIGSPSFL